MLRQLMIDLAQRIRMQMLENLRDRVVSLMIDGCKRWGRLYEGVVIYTSERLYLYSILKMRDGTARTLEAILAEIIETLNRNNTPVVSINSDNASVSLAALNGNLQNLTESHFIRQPCAAHTLNLAIEDTFWKNHRARRIYNDIELLVRCPPETSIRVGYSNKLATIRWISLFSCVDFIYRHKQQYQQVRIPKVSEALQHIENGIGLENLHEIMNSMHLFLSAIERDCASIADVIPSFIHVQSRLIWMSDWLSKILLGNLCLRLTTTCSLHLPWVAYFLLDMG